jgi:hypothetical protein
MRVPGVNSAMSMLGSSATRVPGHIHTNRPPTSVIFPVMMLTSGSDAMPLTHGKRRAERA